MTKKYQTGSKTKRINRRAMESMSKADLIELIEDLQYQLEAIRGDGDGDGDSLLVMVKRFFDDLKKHYKDNGEKIKGVTWNEARMLCALLNGIEERNKIFAAIYADCFADGDEPEIKIIDVYLCRLRTTLSYIGFEIETIWGRGYKIANRKELTRILVSHTEAGPENFDNTKSIKRFSRRLYAEFLTQKQKKNIAVYEAKGWTPSPIAAKLNTNYQATQSYVAKLRRDRKNNGRFSRHKGVSA